VGSKPKRRRLIDMSKRQKGNDIPPAGEIRQSQIVSSYGPGSMVDLPEKSIIVGGLNHWKFGETKKRIDEERLERKLSKLLEAPIVLYEPPASQENTAGRVGINTFIFPNWFVAQIEGRDSTWKSPNGKEYRTRPLVPHNHLSSGKYLDGDRKKHPVVPIRFVQACLNGHISDINWRKFVHENSDSKCPGTDLWLDEGGTGSDFVDIFVRCENCGARRPLSDATLPQRNALGFCEGHRPWLGKNSREDCIDENTKKPFPNRLLVRSASNAYFSQVLNVISLPNTDEKLRQSVGLVYEHYLQYAEEIEDITRERRKDRVAEALKGFTDQVVWEEVQRRKSNKPSDEKNIKEIEIETLTSQPDEVGEDTPDNDFYARNRDITGLDASLKGKINRIVLVHRLREVVALVGFTRFEPGISDIDGELDLSVKLASLDIETKWVPAVENKGEGIFIGFSPESIEKWLKKEAVKERGQALSRGFEKWLERKDIKPGKLRFPGLPYIMLHSLSHLLITTLSLESGYSASAIKERIYAVSNDKYGILLYTGSPSSEGTLGGLVQEGNRIEKHIANAIKLGQLCSNDPICAGHQPEDTYEERFLHGAACHGCLLIAETSCERRNEYLDRALIIPTIETPDAAFFI